MIPIRAICAGGSGAVAEFAASSPELAPAGVALHGHWPPPGIKPGRDHKNGWAWLKSRGGHGRIASAAELVRSWVHAAC